MILGISLCLSSFSKAQTPPQDSVVNAQNQTVHVAYGTQPAWMVTGAVSTVQGSDLEDIYSPDFPSRLYGKLPGLTVVPNGTEEPGNQSTSLYSRGVNTFGVGVPGILILVDGIESNINDLVPQEIESVTLLKDAASTAMYGSKAANGVLLVTTKRGFEGPLKVEFSTQQGIQYPFRESNYLGSYDYARLYNEALQNDGKPAKYTQSDLSDFQSGNDPYFHPNVNWNDELLQKASGFSNYDLNFRGGSKTVRYFVLLNYLNNENLYRRTGDESDFSINGKYQRINFRSNVDINVTNSLTANFTIGGTVVDKANPYAITTNDIFNQMSLIPPDAFPVYAPNGAFARNSLYSNPLANILNSGFYTSDGRTLQTIMGLTQNLDKVVKGLSITARTAFNSWFLSQSNKTRTYISDAFSKDPVSGDIIYNQYGINTSLVGNEGESDQWRRFAFQTMLNYNRTFGTNTLEGILLWNADDYTISGNNFPAKHNNLSGRLTYAYNQKYVGEVSFAYMGSGGFPSGKQYGFFPAASVGWVISNEDFLKGNDVINYLKIKGSYGLVGNDSIGGPSFMFDQTYPYASSYYFGTNNSAFNSIVQGILANPNVTWEKEKSYNIGIEAKIMKNIGFTFDFFNRDRYDILVQPLVSDPDFKGYTKPYLNQGKANDKGFEATLSIQNDASSDFRYFVDASVSYYKNKVVYNAEAIQAYDYLRKTGQPINQPFGLEAIGLFKDQADIDASATQAWTVVQPGDVKYKDQNDDKFIDENDVVPIGNTGLPTFIGALHIGLRYKAFDLDVFFQGESGRSAYFSGYYFEAFQNNGKAGPIALDRWTPETAETATYPRLSSMDNDNNYRYSSFWQRDGSYLKLRSLQLGYTLPNSLTEKVLLSNVRVYLNGTNLFSLDHMDGYRDPEFPSSLYPAFKSYSIGVKVQFK